LLDPEASARRTDEGTFNVSHLQQIDDRVNIGQLFRSRRAPWLSEDGTEVEGFADGGQRLMNIQLLAIPGGTLKGQWERASVNVNLSFDFAFRLALCQYI
jgi:hypothetical protein